MQICARCGCVAAVEVGGLEELELWSLKLELWIVGGYLVAVEL
jgi:hypothetical protein